MAQRHRLVRATTASRVAGIAGIVGIAFAGAMAPLGAARAGSPVAPSAGSVPGAVRVSMKDFAFAPATVTVRAGQAVTWTYDESAQDPMPNCEAPELSPPSPVTCPGHSTTAVATAAGGRPLWDSGVHRASGFPYSVRFLVPGTYRYYCTVHGGAHPNNPVTHMDGTVVVLAAASAASAPASTPASAPAASAPPPAVGPGPSEPASGLPATGRLPRGARRAAALALGAGVALGWIRRRTRREASPEDPRRA